MPRAKEKSKPKGEVTSGTGITPSKSNKKSDNKDASTTPFLVQSFEIASEKKPIACETRGDGETSLIFTHGAGGGITGAAMVNFADGFASCAKVLSFQGTLHLGSRVKAFVTVLDHEGGKCALGGRSMGARAAVLTALERTNDISALVLVSYPLTGGKDGTTREPEKREQPLLNLGEDVDVLFVIGDQDAQCDLDLLRDMRTQMKARSWLVEVSDADHGMNIKPKKAVRPLGLKTGQIAAAWLSERDADKTHSSISWDQEQITAVQTDWKS